MIFEKILYRLIVLLNENQEIKEKYTKLKKILDELIGYISKIIIITPCIDQVKGTKKFDITLLETFMEKIKEFCLNKEKFYMHLLLSLYKFCEKDEEFPKILDPKPSATYFLKFLKDGYLETKSERLLNVLKEFISETKLLNLEEKKQLLINENVNNNNNKEKNIEDSFDQNMDEPEEGNKNVNNNIYAEDGEQEENENEDLQNNIYYSNNKKASNNINNNKINDEDKEVEDLYNNKIKNEILNRKDDDKVINNDTNNIVNNNFNNNSNNNIILKLKQFQERLNKIPTEDKQKETTELSSDDKKSKEEQMEYNNKITPTKINYSNNKNTKDTTTDDNNNINNTNNKLNKSKLNDNDFQKIEDSIRLMSKRLDNTLNKMNEVSHRNVNSRKTNIITSNSLTSQQGIINNLNSINNSINISKISENNNNNASIITNESYLKNNFINLNFNNNNINTNPNTNPNTNKDIIQQIINAVKGESTKNNNIYQTAKNHFLNLTSIEEKIEFIKLFRTSLENPIYLKQVPINSCTNLLDFILSILSYQILSQSDEQIIVNLQAVAEYLLPYRSLNDMFKIMLFLLKKYFPKNLNNKIEDISLVMIKVISYLLKELLKKMNKDNVAGTEIICEINDLFTVTPPSTLTTATPNALFYQQIFTLLKSITDQIVNNNKNELVNIIQYLQENKIVCEDYIQYLIRLQKSR